MYNTEQDLALPWPDKASVGSSINISLSKQVVKLNLTISVNSILSGAHIWVRTDKVPVIASKRSKGILYLKLIRNSSFEMVRAMILSTNKTNSKILWSKMVSIFVAKKFPFLQTVFTNHLWFKNLFSLCFKNYLKYFRFLLLQFRWFFFHFFFLFLSTQCHFLLTLFHGLFTAFKHYLRAYLQWQRQTATQQKKEKNGKHSLKCYSQTVYTALNKFDNNESVTTAVTTATTTTTLYWHVSILLKILTHTQQQETNRNCKEKEKVNELIFLNW